MDPPAEKPAWTTPQLVAADRIAASARTAAALERIADSVEALEDLPKRLRALELTIEQADLR